MPPGASQAEKAAAFRALHEGEPFLIPNPWDAGSARVLEALGFKALATTSSGFAFTPGRLDGGATLDNVAAHTRLLAATTGVPLSVDLENGCGPDPEDAAAILRVAEAGAVGARRRSRVANRGGAVPGQRRPVLDPRLVAVPAHAGQCRSIR